MRNGHTQTRTDRGEYTQMHAPNGFADRSHFPHSLPSHAAVRNAMSDAAPLGAEAHPSQYGSVDSKPPPSAAPSFDVARRLAPLLTMLAFGIVEHGVAVGKCWGVGSWRSSCTRSAPVPHGYCTGTVPVGCQCRTSAGLGQYKHRSIAV